MKYREIQSQIRQKANKNKAKILQGFFKTGKGQYGEGDIFIGLTVPEARCIATAYKDVGFTDMKALLHSKTHEDRLVALEILVSQFESTKNLDFRQKIFDFYLKNRAGINNWDLVDLSAPYIVGEYLLHSKNLSDKNVIYKLARSKNIWDRRIAIVSTYSFIRARKFSDTLKIAEILLTDEHDLIHKAVGWMLREVGKKNLRVLEKFLQKNSAQMPRTMLRYAIEKFSPQKRQKYLKSGQNIFSKRHDKIKTT